MMLFDMTRYQTAQIANLPPPNVVTCQQSVVLHPLIFSLPALRVQVNIFSVELAIIVTVGLKDFNPEVETGLIDVRIVLLGLSAISVSREV
jgi:hypothetical protein